MLRLLYLLSLVLCIELSFSYNYLDDTAEGRHVRRNRVRKVRRPRERKSLVRHEYDYDRRPVEFDVASFIQPDDELIEDNEISTRLRDNKRRSSSNYEYGSLIGLKVDDKKKERTPDYPGLSDAAPDLNFNPQILKDANALLLNSKHPPTYNTLDDHMRADDKYGHEKFRNIYKDDLLMDQNIVHSHEKKCTLKNLKFPFFSHNKSEPLKPKKNKKRKLFCFSCPKKGSKYPDENKMIDDGIGHYKIKRSFDERLCPMCRKKFLVSLAQNERRKKASRKMLHNSRQYYQNISPETKFKEGKKNLRRKNNLLYTNEGLEPSRNKREEDRERQLKELEEVQRKIDNVDISVPTFEKPAEKSPY